MRAGLEFSTCMTAVLALPIAIGAALVPQAARATPMLTWDTVVNNAIIAPTSTPQQKTAYYFSYNQPAVNISGEVAFRARAKPLSGGGGGGGGGGGTVQGVYTRDMGQAGSAIQVLADNKGTVVPAPNTTGATFVEFPSVPRIDQSSSTVTFRGQSQPVYTLLDGTKTGTSGVFTNPGGTLITGVNQLGDAGFTQFQVPNTPVGTGFDQFPGAPASADGSTLVFKGNYTVNGVGDTGVFYRNTASPTAPVVAIAQSGEAIPGGGGATFGSTAPPTAAQGKVVFTGYNNEAAPTAGGIYIAPLKPSPTLTPLVSIGQAVPGVSGQTFTGFGEALSFDGKNVGFWGSWGSATMTVHMTCPTEGNAARTAYCLQQYPNGVNLTEPKNQGIFVADSTTGQIKMIAQTGQNGFTDFLSWNFSGAVPGTSTDAEPARWRSSAYVSSVGDNVVFLGQKSTVDGLYAGFDSQPGVQTLLDTTFSGQSVDPAAPTGSLISSIGLERDGYRNGWLAITATMLDPTTAESWAGIYVANVPEPGTLALLGGFALAFGAVRRRGWGRGPDAGGRAGL